MIMGPTTSPHVIFILLPRIIEVNKNNWKIILFHIEKEYESYLIRGYTFQKRALSWIRITHGLQTMKDPHFFFQ